MRKIPGYYLKRGIFEKNLIGIFSHGGTKDTENTKGEKEL